MLCQKEMAHLKLQPWPRVWARTAVATARACGVSSCQAPYPNPGVHQEKVKLLVCTAGGQQHPKEEMPLPSPEQHAGMVSWCIQAPCCPAPTGAPWRPLWRNCEENTRPRQKSQHSLLQTFWGNSQGIPRVSAPLSNLPVPDAEGQRRHLVCNLLLPCSPCPLLFHLLHPSCFSSHPFSTHPFHSGMPPSRPQSQAGTMPWGFPPPALCKPLFASQKPAWRWDFSEAPSFPCPAHASSCTGCWQEAE